jgi:hypothetical protein
VTKENSGHFLARFVILEKKYTKNSKEFNAECGLTPEISDLENFRFFFFFCSKANA